STAFILFAILGAFCFYRFIYPNKQVEKELKTDKFKNEKEFTFTFYEKFFVISDKKKSEKIKYWKLYRVYETKEFFYLYIDNNHAFLLNKSTFIKGNTSNFLKFLKRKIWFKFL
ncbi:MAG: YcxB family protein, partial [Clostridia bacterium]